MIYVVLVFLGVVLFLIGNHLLNDYDGLLEKVGICILVIGWFLVIGGVFMTRPIESNAEEINEVRYIKGAGITAHMNATLYSALNEPELTTTEEEIDLLARMMTAEQGYGASETDYYMTGSVVINRIRSENFPNTLYDVIYQNNPRQYQCVSNGHINREYDDVAWEVAEELLTEGTTVDERVVYQAEFTQGRGIYTQRGKTFYCYE